MQKSKYDSSLITCYHARILIKSVFNKNKNNHYYNMFLEKASYELPKK